MLQAVSRCQQGVEKEVEAKESVLEIRDACSAARGRIQPTSTFPASNQRSIAIPSPSSPMGLAGTWFTEAIEQESVNSYPLPVVVQSKYPSIPQDPSNPSVCRLKGPEPPFSQHGPNSFTRPPELGTVSAWCVRPIPSCIM